MYMSPIEGVTEEQFDEIMDFSAQRYPGNPKQVGLQFQQGGFKITGEGCGY